MKNSTLPAVRVDDELRAAAENVLSEGETLTSFIEQTVRQAVERRQVLTAFEARARASRAKAKRSGVYHPAAEVHAELSSKLEAKRKALLR